MAATATVASAEETDPLRIHLWASRVLVVSAPGEQNRALRIQRRAIDAARAGASERDLVTIEAVGPGAVASALRRRLALPAGGFRAVLVGKDGGAKLISSEPIPSERLFSTIDAMPMRRNEMQRR